MKRILFTLATIFMFLFAQFTFAADLKIGVVNITELFNDSAFVKKANEQLQEKVKGMETKVQAQQKKVQDLAAQYDKAKENDKENLRKQITSEQNKLQQMTQDYQQQIRDEQNVGMQKFSDSVRIAVQEVAKKQGLNAVFSNTAIIWSDSSWVDVTKAVAATMQ